MHTDKSSHPTHLFTVRLWREDLGHDRHEWRGQIQQVGTGEVRYFRDWQGIVACIEELLTESEGARRE